MVWISGWISSTAGTAPNTLTQQHVEQRKDGGARLVDRGNHTAEREEQPRRRGLRQGHTGGGKRNGDAMHAVGTAAAACLRPPCARPHRLSITFCAWTQGVAKSTPGCEWCAACGMLAAPGPHSHAVHACTLPLFSHHALPLLSRAWNASRPEVGSSKNSNEGLLSSSTPTLTRLRSPPDTPRTYALCAGQRPESCEAKAAWFRRGTQPHWRSCSGNFQKTQPSPRQAHSAAHPQRRAPQCTCPCTWPAPAR